MQFKQEPEKGQSLQPRQLLVSGGELWFLRRGGAWDHPKIGMHLHLLRLSCDRLHRELLQIGRSFLRLRRLS